MEPDYEYDILCGDLPTADLTDWLTTGPYLSASGSVISTNGGITNGRPPSICLTPPPSSLSFNTNHNNTNNTNNTHHLHGRQSTLSNANSAGRITPAASSLTHSDCNAMLTMMSVPSVHAVSSSSMDGLSATLLNVHMPRRVSSPVPGQEQEQDGGGDGDKKKNKKGEGFNDEMRRDGGPAITCGSGNGNVNGQGGAMLPTTPTTMTTVSEMDEVVHGIESSRSYDDDHFMLMHMHMHMHSQTNFPSPHSPLPPTPQHTQPRQQQQGEENEVNHHHHQQQQQQGHNIPRVATPIPVGHVRDTLLHGIRDYIDEDEHRHVIDIDVQPRAHGEREEACALGGICNGDGYQHVDEQQQQEEQGYDKGSGRRRSGSRRSGGGGGGGRDERGIRRVSGYVASKLGEYYRKSFSSDSRAGNVGGASTTSGSSGLRARWIRSWRRKGEDGGQTSYSRPAPPSTQPPSVSVPSSVRPPTTSRPGMDYSNQFEQEEERRQEEGQYQEEYEEAVYEEEMGRSGHLGDDMKKKNWRRMGEMNNNNNEEIMDNEDAVTQFSDLDEDEDGKYMEYESEGGTERNSVRRTTSRLAAKVVRKTRMLWCLRGARA